MVNQLSFHNWLGFLLLQFFLQTAAFTQQQEYGFQELEKMVLTQDRKMASIEHQMRAIESQKAATSAYYLPKLRSSYRYLSDGFNLTQDDFGRKHFLSFRISQDLVKLFKVRSQKLKGLDAELTILNSELQDSQRLAVLEFRNNYIEVMQNQTRVFYYAKLTEIYEKILKIQRKRYQENEELLTAVLKTEKELINVKGLHDHYKTELLRQKAAVAAAFNLQASELSLEEIELTHVELDEARLLNIAIENSSTVHITKTRAQLADLQAKSVYYENFNIAPFIGLRIRGDQFSALQTGAELGVSFSIPLWYKHVRTQKSNQYLFQSNSLDLVADEAAILMQQKITSVLNDYRLLSVQLRNKNDILDMLIEKSRIEKSRQNNELRSIKIDPVELLQINVNISAERLQKDIYEFEKDKRYYELIYLAGMVDPQVFAFKLQKNKNFAGRRSTQAIWLWQAEEVLSQKAREEFIEFCKYNNIKQIFFSLNEKIVAGIDDTSALGDFLMTVHRAGIRVSALIGDPFWVYEKNRHNLIRKLEFIIAYNKLAQDEKRFDAVHLDIEPHALAEWSDYKSYLINHLVQTVKDAKEVLSSNLPKLKLEIDLPTFYHKIDKAALEKLVQYADLITIMAYQRKTHRRVLDSIEELTSLIQRMNKEYMIGLNAKDFETAEILKTLTSEIGKKVELENSFAGFAIHDYWSYSNLIHSGNAL